MFDIIDTARYSSNESMNKYRVRLFNLIPQNAKEILQFSG